MTWNAPPGFHELGWLITVTCSYLLMRNTSTKKSGKCAIPTSRKEKKTSSLAPLEREAMSATSRLKKFLLTLDVGHAGCSQFRSGISVVSVACFVTHITKI